MGNLRSIFIIFITSLFFAESVAQCTESSQVVSYSSVGLHTMSSIISEDQGFSIAGSVIENGETDYVLYQFLDELNLVNTIRISSDFNDSGNRIIHERLTNGNYVIAGFSQVGSQRHLKIICFDQDNVLWQKRLVGTSEVPRAIHALDNGGVLLVGSSSTQSNGSVDAFAIEMDQNGNVIWKKGFGSSDNEHFYDAITSFSGLHLAVGNNATFSGTHRPILSTIDNGGNLIDYNLYTGAALGIFTTIVKYNNNYFAGGFIELGDRAGMIAALDENYEVLWSKRVDIEGFNSNYVSGIGVDDNGFLFVSAPNEGSNSKLHYLKLDPSNGDLISAVTTTPDIPSNEVSTVAGYQLSNTNAGMLSVSNVTNSGDFVIVGTNECLDNSDCLEDAEITLLNYNLTRTDYSPGERILQDVFDISQFQVSTIELPVAEACGVVCLGSLSVPGASGCVNESIEFLLDLEGEDSDILTYFWEFEDGSSSNLSDLVITTSIAGVQDYTLTITTENGCEYTAIGVFSVSDVLELPEIETEVTLCEGEFFELDAADFSDWTITDSDGDELDVFVTSEAGLYSFTFTSACSVEQIDISIDQITISDFVDFEDQTICTGSDVVIDVPNWESVAAESDIQITLESNASVSYLGDPLAFTFSEDGIYTFVIDGSILNCPFNETFQIEVFSIEPPEIETNVTLCEGEFFELDAADFSDWTITDSDGDELDVFVTSEAGLYSFTFTSACSVEQIDISIDQITISDFVDFEDQTICTGSDVVIDVPNWESVAAESDIQITLESNASVSYLGDPLAFTFSEDGIYTFMIDGSILNCPFNETFQIEVVSPPESFAQNNYNICGGDEIDLDFSDLPFDVFDSEGEAVVAALISTDGTYVFTGQNACSSFEEVITVNETLINPPSFGDFQFLCEGQDTLAIGFNSSDYDYLWDSGSQESNIFVFESGQYEVLVIDTTGGCDESFVFQVNSFPFAPSEIFEFPAVEICLEGQTNINFPPQFGPYTFSDASAGLTYTATETESLSFTYSDGCYTYQDTLFISVESCLCPAWVPNIFTPNEDGLNDLFKPVLDCEVYDYQMLVFNRWGREIFQSNDINTAWRGESPNSDFYASTGIYVYLIVFNQELDGLRVPTELTGTVTLLR